MSNVGDASASVIANAVDLGKWAAGAVKETDRLIAISATRPLSPQEMSSFLHVHRELLVRLTQRDSLTSWAVSVWSAHLSAMSPPPAPVVRPWWKRWMRVR